MPTTMGTRVKYDQTTKFGSIPKKNKDTNILRNVIRVPHSGALSSQSASTANF